MTALSLRSIGKRYGESEVLRQVDLDILPGQRHAVIGPNGAGKTTLFDIASGRTTASNGWVLLHGEDITQFPPHWRARRGLARSFQITSLFPVLSVFENLRAAVLAATPRRYTWWRSLNAMRDIREQADDMLRSTGLQSRRNDPAGELSYAEQRTLELGVTVAGGASVILLDEPTAGMSASETKAAITLIRRLTEGRTLLIIEHDMNVVFDLADQVSVLVRGELVVSDTPQRVRDNAVVRETYLGSAAVTRIAREQ